MENVQDMTLVGYYYFQAKDGKTTYFVIQCLVSEVQDSNYNRGNIINVFVDKDIFNRIVNDFDIGSVLKVQSSINYATRKAFYSIVL